MNPSQSKDLMDRSHRFAHLLGRIHHFYHKQTKGPLLHPGQGRLLYQILEKEPVSQKDLAFLLDIRPSSLSELLKKLEDKGLIARAPDDDDKRNMVVTLTGEGKALVQQAAQGREALEAKVFDPLSEEELSQLSSLLGKLTDSWQATLDEAGEPSEPPHHGPHRGPCEGPGPHHGPHHERRPGADSCPRRHHMDWWEESFPGWKNCR